MFFIHLNYPQIPRIANGYKCLTRVKILVNVNH
jgi:hypothetical protein